MSVDKQNDDETEFDFIIDTLKKHNEMILDLHRKQESSNQQINCLLGFLQHLKFVNEARGLMKIEDPFQKNHEISSLKTSIPPHKEEQKIVIDEKEAHSPNKEQQFVDEKEIQYDKNKQKPLVEEKEVPFHKKEQKSVATEKENLLPKKSKEVFHKTPKTLSHEIQLNLPYQKEKDSSPNESNMSLQPSGFLHYKIIQDTSEIPKSIILKKPDFNSEFSFKLRESKKITNFPNNSYYN
jgi:hypothetical protein